MQARLHRIAKIREKTGKSQQKIARLLGIPLTRLIAVENETSDVWLSDLHLMSKALGVPVQDLVIEPDVMPQPGNSAEDAYSDIENTIRELKDEVQSEESRAMVQMLKEMLQEIRDDQ